MSAIIRGGISGLDADVDANRSVEVTTNNPAHPTAGGFYTVAGQTAAVVAATLAANTPLMTMRFSPSSTRRAYITKIRILVAASTVGTSATIPGTIGLQRFTAATPTGGTARTVNKLSEALGAASDMTDVRDSNAALTVTGVTFGNIVSNCVVPLFITSGPMLYEWIFEPAYPLVLVPGDGICLRTLVVMPATQTFVYSYTAHWNEGPVVA